MSRFNCALGAGYSAQLDDGATEGFEVAPPSTRPRPRDDPDFWLSLGVDITTRDGTNPATLTLGQLSEIGRAHLEHHTL